MPPALSGLSRNFKFILVSGSPRRKELLQNLGLRFTVVKPGIEEKIRPAHYRQDIVRVARDKINSVPALSGQILIACDTLVICAGKVLGKPKNSKQAAEFLRLLSGRKHTVLSCLAVKAVRQKKIYLWHKTTATKVWFRKISTAEIIKYVKTPVPYDKAGAYGIQDPRSLFVSRIKGCYYNVVGLPVSSLIDILTLIWKKEQNRK